MNHITPITKSKPHYEILDGLRGVAAILVVLFHLFEIFSEGNHTKQIINHGYLAVDFFFLLSGFVLGYAYDDRWKNMTLKDFLKRRFIRLQPMIVIGTMIGAILFYFQASPALGWERISETPVWIVIIVMFIGLTLFPVGKGLDIRGWNEMHPLNGAAWSLFFEYIANIIYALILRKVTTLILYILVIVAASATIYYAYTNANGDIIGGWAIDDPTQLKIGFIRLTFPFLAGLLMARICKIQYIRNAFVLASILLVIVLAMPHLGGENNVWNRTFECFCLIIVFPIIIWIGASGQIKEAKTKKLCTFLGNISYPIYITHFPLVNVYMAYIANHNLTLSDASSWYIGGAIFLVSLLVAYISMRFYDIPIRKWLRRRFL